MTTTVSVIVAAILAVILLFYATAMVYDVVVTIVTAELARRIRKE